MADTTFTTTGAPLRPIKAVLYAPALAAGNLQAWNPTLAIPAFDNITLGNYGQHLITVPEPGSMGVYVLDLAALSPALPTGISIDCRFYSSSIPGDLPFAAFPTCYWNGTILTLSSVNAMLINAQVPTPFPASQSQDVDISTTVTRGP